MAQELSTKNQISSLQWIVKDKIPEGVEPVKIFWWRPDPEACRNVEADETSWNEYLISIRRSLEDAHFPWSYERAAIVALLNLVPSLTGTLSHKFETRITSLFRVLDGFSDRRFGDFTLPGLATFSAKELIAENLHRALLSDALTGALDRDEWLKKSLLFLEFSAAVNLVDCHVWNRNIFTEFGWPEKITPDVFDVPVRPDLITVLCLYGKHNYASYLIGRGYDLTDFILFNFQPFYWRGGNDGPISLEHVPECVEASCQREEGRDHDRKHTRNRALDEEERKALRILFFLGDLITLDERVGSAVAAALSYIHIFQCFKRSDSRPDESGSYNHE